MKSKKFIKRSTKVRAKLKKVANRLRLHVFRSNKHIYAQIIDDQKSVTLVSANDKEIKPEKELSKITAAMEVGKILATKAKKKKIDTVYFDRGGYKYFGRVKALAEGARSGGLKF